MLNNAMQDPPRSILFVCLGNICRSPAAENTLRHFAKEQGVADELAIDSAGTIDYHRGKSPDSRMCETLENRGIACSGTSRPVVAEDFEKFDLILAADNSNLRDLHSMLANSNRAERDSDQEHPSDEKIGSKIKLICDFCEEFEDTEVPDPYYGGREGFEKVADLLEDACGGILRQSGLAV